MSHSIKVSDEVYEELQKVQGARESYSQVIEKLLRVYRTLFAVKETLGPGHYLAERPKQEVKLQG